MQDNSKKSQAVGDQVYIELLDQISARNNRIKLLQDQLNKAESQLAEYSQVFIDYAAVISEHDQLVAERDQLAAERDQLVIERDHLTIERDQFRDQLLRIRATRAWKIVIIFYGLWAWGSNLVRKAFSLPVKVSLMLYRVIIPAKSRASIRQLLGIDFKRETNIEFKSNEFASKSGLENLKAKPDFIVLSIIELEARFQRPQQMAVHLTRHGHRVFYISSAKFISHNGNERYRIREVAPLVFEVILPMIRQPEIYAKPIDAETQEIFREAIWALAKDHRIYTAVQLVQLPFWTDLALEMRDLYGWKVIYDCMDEWDDFPGFTTDILNRELGLVEASDLVTVTSSILYEKWHQRARKCVLVRNAVDFELFVTKVRPNDIIGDDIGHPIIGYYGAIAEWIDLELIKFLATNRRDWNFIVVGDVFVNVDILSGLPNVHLIGRRPYEEMPLFLYHFDVCIIPFVISRVTHAVDPVKLYEYLSAGKPVVASRIDELLHYDDYLYLAETHEQFLHSVEQGLLENDLKTEKRRIDFARQNTWDKRIEVLSENLQSLYDKFSIIIVTYQNVALTRHCIESILRNTDYPNYEIIIVDNASIDGTRAYLRYLARKEDRITIILNNENEGFAAANNQGLHASHGQRIVLLNNDTIVLRGWLTGLSRYLNRPEIGLVGPVTNFAGNEARIQVNYENFTEMENFADKWMREHENEYFDIKVLAMYCVAMRRDVFDEIGYLDEKFGTGLFEDDDYTERVRHAGYRIVCAQDVFVHHHGQAAFKKLLGTKEYDELWERNQTYFEQKWQKNWEAHKQRE